AQDRGADRSRSRARAPARGRSRAGPLGRKGAPGARQLGGARRVVLDGGRGRDQTRADRSRSAAGGQSGLRRQRACSPGRRSRRAVEPVAIRALLCSANEHKRRELGRALPAWEIELLKAHFPPEEGESYFENALAKARFGRTLRPDAWLLGEDS